MNFELSYTRRVALACPYSFKRLYATGESTAQQLDASAGIIGHELIARYIMHLARRHRQRDTEWLVRLFDHEMQKQDPYIRDFLEKPLANFMESYTHRRGIVHLVEREYWSTADGKPLGALEPGTALRCDCYHGRADHIEVEYDGAKATVRDHKLGWNQKFLKLDAQDNEQLMGYCWLYLIHHPECQEIVGAIQPWRYTKRPIYASWKREHLCEVMPEIIGKDFAKVRSLYMKHGDGDWPAEPDYEKVCRWCMISCPLYEGED
jgi:hypothetical protein